MHLSWNQTDYHWCITWFSSVVKICFSKMSSSNFHSFLKIKFLILYVVTKQQYILSADICVPKRFILEYSGVVI